MNKLLAAILALCTAGGCTLYAVPSAGDAGFPLKLQQVVSVDAPIQKITVSQTWIAVVTPGKLIGIDIDSKRVLWSADFPVIPDAHGLITTEDNVIAASYDRVVMFDRDGHQRRLNLDVGTDQVIGVAAASAAFVYIVEGPLWTLDAYELAAGRVLWKAVVGRAGAETAFLDPTTNVLYVSGMSIKAFDNQTGSLLWKIRANALNSTLENNVLYSYVQASPKGTYNVEALRVGPQALAWERTFQFLPAAGVNDLQIVDDRLLLCGAGLVALDKASGAFLWTAPIGETLYKCPAVFGNRLYAKTGPSRTVFAIDADSGRIIGHVRLDNTRFLGEADAVNGVYALKESILFNTHNALVFYGDR